MNSTEKIKEIGNLFAYTWPFLVFPDITLETGRLMAILAAPFSCFIWAPAFIIYDFTEALQRLEEDD